jgi:DNA-binding transcriptional ArsR family regulator
MLQPFQSFLDVSRSSARRMRDDLVLADVGLEFVERTCIRRFVQHILNRMVQYMKARLDASFAALSDATRRGVLEQLGGADASITDLAETFHMTLTGMRKHVGVLERAQLVTTEKVGRVRSCKLGPRRLEEETAWIERYRQLWDSRFDELDRVVEELKRKEKVDGRSKKK